MRLSLALLLFLSGCSTLPQSEAVWPLRYNYLEKEWSYAPRDAALKYNYLEERWEFSK